MRTGRYPIASSFILAMCLAKFVVWQFYPEKSPVFDPWFDGIMMGAIVVFLLYYARIFIGAWLNNRREGAE